MPASPATAEFDAAVSKATTELFGHAFDGNFEAFHRTFQDYLDRWGTQDPFARHLLRKADSRNNLLSFRSTSTDRKELNRQTSLRWDAWLSVMPLDMQLGLLQFEASPYVPSPDFAKLHWHQWSQVSESPNPTKAFRTSPLGGWVTQRKAGPGSPMNHTQNMYGETETSPKTWDETQGRLVSLMHSVAIQLIAFKKWDDLDSYMGHAGLSATARLQDVYVHHRTSGSRGSTLAYLDRDLPFWASGLYAGAVEPEFWRVMARHGGPQGPCLGPAWDSADRPRKAGLFAPPPADLLGATEWIDPQAKLDPAALESISHVAAAWRAQILDQAMQPTLEAAPPRSPRL